MHAFFACVGREKLRNRPAFALDDERPAGAFDFDSSLPKIKTTEPPKGDSVVFGRSGET